MIAHFDLDAFFVSVERVLNPNLNGKPIIIGGTSEKGVVSTCSYEARKFGVHSAMPSYRARKLCPNGIFLKGSHKEYSIFSDKVTQIITEEAPEFYKASIDEFYINLKGLERFFSLKKWADHVQNRILKETGLPCSYGISVTKTFAKMATNIGKPFGATIIPLESIQEVFNPLPIENVPMVGEKFLAKLHELEIKTIADLTSLSPSFLNDHFGSHGISLLKKLTTYQFDVFKQASLRKSISNEMSFFDNITSLAQVKEIISKQIEKTTFSLRKKQLLTSCIGLKIRYYTFKTYTFQAMILPTCSDIAIEKTVFSLLDKNYKNLPVRLIGIKFSKLQHANIQSNLFDLTPKNLDAIKTIDVIKEKYGKNKITKAKNL